MAKLSNPKLIINLNDDFATVDIDASVDFTLDSSNPTEVYLVEKAGVKFQVKCRIIGNDSNELLSGDGDYRFWVDNTKTVGSSGTVCFHKTAILHHKLDEGLGCNDDICARFICNSTISSPLFPANISPVEVRL